jgi:catalase (peroxidase I)
VRRRRPDTSAYSPLLIRLTWHGVDGFVDVDDD